MKGFLFIAWLVLFPAMGFAEIPEYVRRNAPVIVGRHDQIKNPITDRILGIGYSVSTRENGVLAVRYTTFFTDEDSKHNSIQTDHQMNRYGRRLDIEWTYEVRINPKTGRGFHRRFACDIFVGIGHATCKFRGKYYRGSDRPILYNVARHNVFGDYPHLPYGSRKGPIYDADPAFEIPFPKSRDLIPVENPEFLRISDEELAREHKLSRPSTEYAFLRVRGKLHGPLHLGIVDSTGDFYSNGNQAIDALQEMGLDLWGQESVVAIALPESVRFGLKASLGTYRLGTSVSRLDLEEAGLYLVDRAADGHYETTDFSSRIRCTVPTDLNTCVIN